MRMLAFDTCFDAVSAAVGARGGDGAFHVMERFERLDKGHAERILPLIRETLTEAGVEFTDLDRLAVTTGPGGFTSVRAGLAVARGLALALGRPLIGIGSLELVAQCAAETVAGDPDVPLLVLMDARKSDAFIQNFDVRVADGGMIAVAQDEPRLVSLEELRQFLRQGPANVVGTATHLLSNLADGGSTGHRILGRIELRAGVLARLAEKRRETGPTRPVYLRAADAKPQTAAAIARTSA